jgi:dynein light chain LC8-type
MSYELQKKVKDVTEKAFDLFNSDLEAVKFIRSTFEDYYKNSVWHCFIGRNFAMNVTSESGYYIYFYIGSKAVALFKSS